MNPLDPKFQEENYKKNPEGFSPEQIKYINENSPQAIPNYSPSTTSTPTPDKAPLPHTSQPLPEWNRPPGISGGKNSNQKKQLLQKLMSNLLGKQGRSMHEVINGVKEALSAYKNYAKEIDMLEGVNSETPGMASVPTPTTGGNPIQKILRGIQEKKSKDGSGGPGIIAPSPVPQTIPTVAPQAINVPPTAQVPVQRMPLSPPINVSANNGYKLPPPVSNLGVYGY